MNAGERATYEAAMTENTLLKAVLDDLKAEGCAPATTSRRRCAGLGERLRAETGLPLTRILAFLGISKSSYEYHRARLGADRHAVLARRGVRVSEKVVRSDRGGHHRWPGWIAICEAAGLTRSMSRKGGSCDNARAGGFFGLLKQEFSQQRLVRGRGGRVLGGPRRVDAVVPLGAHLAGARLAHARRAPACPRACGVGTRKCPQAPFGFPIDII